MIIRHKFTRAIINVFHAMRYLHENTKLTLEQFLIFTIASVMMIGLTLAILTIELLY